VVSLKVVVNLIDGVYALMAIPTMTSSLLLAPQVKQAAALYFQRIEENAVMKKRL